MNKLVVILGPTASGKSDLAIKLAKLFKGEIVSADSRQVYQGMDIGTGKVPRDQNTKYKMQNTGYYSQGVPHYLLDVASPKEYFSAAQYQKLAVKAIKDIQRRNKLPILCGGTGLYISSVIEGWQFPEVPPDKKLRKKLAALPSKKLYLQLKKLSPERAKNIDRNNRRRLIRALEIALTAKSIPPLLKKPPDWDILILGVKKDKETLKALIKKRLNKRLKEGMIEEIKNLKKQKISSKRLFDFGLEYRWINEYLENRITLPEMEKGLYQEIVKFSKRQMTWFKKIKNVYWIRNNKEAIKRTKIFLEN
ncbi:MAG: tRNA (adenosine(37)-N6)-dimethylallyltransferase MiaA [Candidatus Paceibacterota bacterium]|jgi:tRNA dimethylallyltransferase|nr:tRNA (adenosine(37)-N6)-dimethylallyltransferase MiaA [Candidatus Paceibacterota bacterium]MDD3548716.1 tRNA (adenosine(37)-N6)-dimethylallyltransferase MiaA [Candidatus Paceibacterota bacterium]MDD4999113.1 tRNA (adenosine(37)-N6)-dimethylallyltransferase MiaA [Candidatus Paceibacterota bacterium]